MRSEAAQQRRQAVLDAATDLFGRKGWPVATADEVAAQAGVTKRTLYSYFGSKQGLLYEVGKAILDVSRKRFEELAALEGSPTTRLRATIIGYAELVFTFQVQYLVFLEELKHLDDSQLAHVTEISGDWVALVSGIIRDGQAGGDFDKGQDPGVGAFTILGMLNGMVYWVRNEGAAWSQDELAEQIVDLVFDGLSVDQTA
ncbi:TetR/AcrR family transcriptional regulator [Mycolicibacterium sp. XJ1819]